MPALEDLLEENLARVRGLLGPRRPEEPRIAAALREALDGPGPESVLRLGRERTVLRLSGGRVLKLYHPQRRGEALRRRLRTAPALREAAVLAPWHPEIRAEQTGPALGLLLRPWLEGRTLETALPEEAVAAGAGLDALLAAGLVDPDLSPRDLLLAGDGRLLPLDGGHARRLPGPAPAAARRAALVLLLAGLPPEAAAACAPVLAEALSLPRAWRAQLEAGARRHRLRSLLHRRHRATRPSRDLVTWGSRGWRRRGVSLDEEEPPVLLARSRRGEVQRRGATVWKRWRRGAGLLRRGLGGGPGLRAWRNHLLLEQAGMPVARGLAWRREAGGETLVRAWVAGRPPGPDELAAVARWLGRLHDLGLGHRDPKAANFLLDEAGRAVLLDADGLEAPLRRPGRDLGRLLAEASPAREDLLIRAWRSAGGPGGQEAEAKRRARAFRRLLASCAPTRAGSGASPPEVPSPRPG